MSGAEIAAVAVAVVLAASAQSLAGFGFALVAVPLMSVAIGPTPAVVTANALGVVLNVAILGEARADIRWRTALLLLAGALFGMPVGLAVLELADPTVLQVIIAVTVLVLTAVLASGLRLPGAGWPLEAGAGFASGVLSTSTSAGGPPLVLGLQARGFPPADFRATLAAVFMSTGVLSFTLLVAAGNWSRTSALALVAGLPSLAVGWVAGRAAFRRADPARFRRVVLVLLVLSGLVALVGALLGD